MIARVFGSNFIPALAQPAAAIRHDVGLPSEAVPKSADQNLVVVDQNHLQLLLHGPIREHQGYGFPRRTGIAYGGPRSGSEDLVLGSRCRQ